MITSFRNYLPGFKICFCAQSQDDWLKIYKMRDEMLSLSVPEAPEFEIDEKFRTLEITLKTNPAKIY